MIARLDSRLLPTLAVLVCVAARAAAGEETGAASSAADLRDPFWPVNYVPAPTEASTQAAAAARAISASEEEWSAARKLLTVKGVSRRRGGNGREEVLAIVNGRLVQAGDIVGVRVAGRLFQWRVGRITQAEGPVFERVSEPAAGRAGGKAEPGGQR